METTLGFIGGFHRVRGLCRICFEGSALRHHLYGSVFVETLNFYTDLD